MIKNWKTTLSGVAIAAVTIAVTLSWITAEQAAAINGVLVAFGLALAKDSNVTGGNIKQ